MKKLKFLLIVSLAALLCCIYASAKQVDERITVATTEEGYNYMMRLIGKQSFSTELPKDKVKDYIKHYTYDSDFAAYYQKTFPSKNTVGYYNEGTWVTLEWHPTYYSLSDGTYSHEGKGAQGCCLYSRHITMVIYKCEGARVYLKKNSDETKGDALKRLLTTYGQAGEHLRIDGKHSVTYISGDDNGFYYFNYENNDWPVITMCYESYETFANRYKNFSIWLYDSNTLTNDLNAQPDPEYFIPGDVAHVTPEPVCKHEKYNSVGFCASCGKEYPFSYQKINGVKFKVTKNVPARIRPYAVAASTGDFKKGDVVSVLGMTRNHHGNPWYLVTCDRLGSGSHWIYSENIKEMNEVKITLNDVVITGDSSVKLSAVCSYTLQRPARVALLIGSTKKDTERIATDEITFSKNPFDIWYDLSNIEKNKVYYYRIIAEYDYLEYPTEDDILIVASDYGSFMISTPKTPIQPELPDADNPEKPDTTVGDKVMDELLDALVPLKFEVKAPTNVTTTSARFNASCTYMGNRPKYVSLYLGLSKDENSMWQVGYDEINFSKNPFDVWYDISGMAENHIYYYQFRAEVDGKIYKSEIKNISTMDRTPIDNANQALLDALKNLKFEVKAPTNVTTTSARFNATCSYSGTRPTYVALYLGLSKDENSMWQVGYDTINFSKNPFDVWYDISGMAENTVYYYQFRVEVGGNLYKSEIKNITTMNRKPVNDANDALLGALGGI